MNMEEQTKILMTKEELDSLKVRYADLLKRKKHTVTNDESKSDIIDGRNSLLREINNLYLQINNAMVVEKITEDDTANIGDTVQINFDGDICTYTLTGVNGNPLNGTISYQSPIGKCIFGRKVGEVVPAKAGNKEIQVQILSISKNEILKNDENQEQILTKTR